MMSFESLLSERVVLSNTSIGILPVCIEKRRETE